MPFVPFVARVFKLSGLRCNQGPVAIITPGLECPCQRLREDQPKLIGYHTYTWNDTAHTEREEEEILSVTYDDGRWSKPYFDCGGGNIWMMTYTVPFFGFANGTYYFKGTSGIDIDLRRVDIDQCPLPPGSKDLNIFESSDKCKNRTTKCVTIKGLGFRRGSYQCQCKDGFYFPDTAASVKYFNGSLIEEEYEKKMLGLASRYDLPGQFECLPCAEGCERCEDDSPCVVSLNWMMRTGILTLAIIIICSLPVIVVFTWKYGNIKVVRAASPALLRIIILGAFFIYSTTLVLYPIPTVISCSLRVWLREIGFSLSYGALMLKTWRISVIFRVRSAKAVKITDLDLMKRLGIIVGVFAVFLGIRTVVAPPQVIVSMTADDLKAFLCSTDWWDHSFTAIPHNETHEFLVNVRMPFEEEVPIGASSRDPVGVPLFLQSPANPDLLFIIFFCHTQLTITILIALIFGSKAYLVLKGQGKDEGSSMTKPNVAKFLQRPNAGNSQNLLTTTSSSGNVEGDMLEEFRKVYMQLEALKERNLRAGNRGMAAKIKAMQDAANTASFTSAPSAPPVTTVVVSEKKETNAERELRRAESRREKKCNDGIIMKPYVNNILANMTDKIVCATFKDEIPSPTKVSPDLAQQRWREDMDEEELSRTSYSAPHDTSETASCRCQSVSHENLCTCETKSEGDTKSDSEAKDLKAMGCRSAEFLLGKSVSSEGTADLSERVCRSLENLDDTSARGGPVGECDLSLEDRSVRSAHSTPRRNQGRFREIRDPDRARAFILYSLSDRATLTEEVTVCVTVSMSRGGASVPSFVIRHGLPMSGQPLTPISLNKLQPMNVPCFEIESFLLYDNLRNILLRRFRMVIERPSTTAPPSGHRRTGKLKIRQHNATIIPQGNSHQVSTS
ncbi:probable G-protein coupled receptor CG31760 [Penaeus indicus]|uniref:probable G-protein coupled receptor CG31760 n=1 Tax=Penaeus indicus TaxID=29960 RepID=UPI00300D9290